MTFLIVGTAASVASGSPSGAASASSVGRVASLSATSTEAAVLPPDGGRSLLTDPGRPRSRLRPLGWRLDVTPSSLLGFSLQVLDLDLEHVDQKSKAMGKRMDWIGAPDVLSIVVDQGQAG